ncbi:Camphene synthase [Streptomyces sp. NPDC051555]|uniref:terpene synthase family protein n=1 Tax=Streptomyces sp. NPDC051555 TaxID=3365657 RepID=UPI0037B1BD68
MSPLPGPTGTGTSAARRFTGPPTATARRTAARWPGPAAEAVVGGVRLECPPPRRDDPWLAARLDERVLAWAEEIGLYHGRLERVREAGFGRLAALCYPGVENEDLLMVPARCTLAIWAMDDHYCDDPSLGATPGLLGSRLAAASAVLGRVHLPDRYENAFTAATREDPALEGLRSAVGHLRRITTPDQSERVLHTLRTLFCALAQEATWRATGHRPRVWEYLVNRQANSFLPCMTVIDALDGYRLPADVWARPGVLDAAGTAALAACIANDIYSAAVEEHTFDGDFNLPRAVRDEQRCTPQEALRISAGLHNELMARFHQQREHLAHLGGSELRRFLDGVLDWCAGSLAWHRTAARYHRHSARPDHQPDHQPAHQDKDRT